MLKKTPFHSRTAALMQADQWRRWAGYTAASAYEMTHDREYMAIRNACALIDVSPLCKYQISGADALRFLNRLVTRDVSVCPIGGMLYTPWCDSRGKVIDDGTIAHLGENRYRLTSAEPNLRWLEDNAISMDVQIEDVSEQIAALALDGARIEAGLIMLDVDYTAANKAMIDAQTSTPLELGLGWAVSWNKGNFVGRQALLAERSRGSATMLVGLEIDHLEFERQHHALGLPVPYPFLAWRAVIPLCAAGEQLGYATSGVWSPTLKKYIALGHLQPNYAALGTLVTLDLDVDRYRRPFNAKVTKLPFFNPPRKKELV